MPLAILPSENRLTFLVCLFSSRELLLIFPTASVEMLLLLMWRHIDHYSNPPAKEEPATGTPVSTPPKGTWSMGLFSPWKSTAKPATPLSRSTWGTSAVSHNQQQSWLAAQAFRRDIAGALKPVLSSLENLQLVRIQSFSPVAGSLMRLYSLTTYPSWTHERECLT
jgi:hypothetical protein